MKSWRQDLISGSNDKMDIKAWLAVVAFAIAIFMYLLYGLVGLFWKWGMDPTLRDITIGLLLGGTVTAGSTLWNQRLGVGPASPATPPTPPPAIPHPADLPAGDGPAG